MMLFDLLVLEFLVLKAILDLTCARPSLIAANKQEKYK
jgi:hypothetical protein